MANAIRGVLGRRNKVDVEVDDPRIVAYWEDILKARVRLDLFREGLLVDFVSYVGSLRSRFPKPGYVRSHRVR